MGTNGNYQTAEEWMAANKTPKYAEDIQNQLEEIKNSIKILRSSQADFKKKNDRINRSVSREHCVSASSGSRIFSSWNAGWNTVIFFSISENGKKGQKRL